MAEINNSLAASINSAPLDIGKTLLTVGQLNALRTKSALEEATTANTIQDTAHNKFLQDQGGGNRPTDTNTLAEAHQKHMGMAGSIGNVMVNDPSPSGVRQAIDMAKKAGVPIDPATEQHLLTSPPQQIVQYGKNMQAAGQQSTSNIEQNPSGIAQRSGAAAGGALAGQTGDVYTPPKPMTSAQVDKSVATQRNADGSRRVLSMEGSVPVQPNAPAAQNPLLRQKQVEAQGEELKGNAARNVEEYAGYKSEAINAASTKYLLRNLNDDADRFPTGKGANVAGATKQWLQAAGQLPGVGPAIQKITGDYSDPVAAFEAVQKNAGQLTRATLKDASGSAASEYRMIQQQLPNAELSPKGLKLVTAQMTAPEDYKQARLQAADSWKKTHSDSLAGFAADWNSKISPSAFLMARLPEEERNGVISRLQKTPEGKNILKGLKGQMQWAHDNGLDSVVD